MSATRPTLAGVADRLLADGGVHGERPLLRRQPRRPAAPRRGRVASISSTSTRRSTRTRPTTSCSADADGTQGRRADQGVRRHLAMGSDSRCGLRGDSSRRGGKVAQALGRSRRSSARSDMLAYLSMMAPRLVELRRVLKPTGSLYLHCDPTASALPQAAHGRRLRARELPQRDRVEADRIEQRCPTFRAASPDDLLLPPYGPDSVLPAIRAVHRGICTRLLRRRRTTRGRYRPVLLTGPGTRTGDSGQLASLRPELLGPTLAASKLSLREVPAADRRGSEPVRADRASGQAGRS